jgi:asparagine N-glycosylation enzyme membrane subunit Stt3
MWLCLLTLSAMQSPFAPGYVLMPAIWLLTILSSEIKGTVSWIVFTIVFALVFLPFPATGNLVAVYSLFHQSLVMAVIVFGLVRKISSRKSLESHPI